MTDDLAAEGKEGTSQIHGNSGLSVLHQTGPVDRCRQKQRQSTLQRTFRLFFRRLHASRTTC